MSMTAKPPPYKQWFPSHSETEGSPVSEYPDIAEPPCRFCRLFAARREYLDNGAPAPMRLCWSEAMLPDFSCYRPREAK